MAETVVVPVLPTRHRSAPGDGPLLRLRVRVPSGHLFAVRGATFSEVVAQDWVIRGTLATTEGEVEAREQGTEAVLLRDRQQTYRYTYATEVLATIQTAATDPRALAVCACPGTGGGVSGVSSGGIHGGDSGARAGAGGAWAADVYLR